MLHDRISISRPASLGAGNESTRARSLATGAALVVLFAALTFVGANIVIPLEPVPVTMQTLFVLLAGAVIGSARGSLSQMLYVVVGGIGMPVFAGGVTGWGVVAGPTGGYLLSFAVAPLLVGALIGRSERIAWHSAVFSLATLVIFAFGVAHLTLFYTHDLAASLRVGVLPFVPGAAFKIVAAVSIYRSFVAIRNRRR